MLMLKVFGSSSKGNCYLLDNGKTKILLDCGVKNILSKQSMNEIDGIILTHRHT